MDEEDESKSDSPNRSSMAMDTIMGLSKEQLISYLIENFGDEIDPGEIQSMSDERVQEFKTLLQSALTGSCRQSSNNDYCDQTEDEEDDDDDVIFVKIVHKNHYGAQQQSNSTSVHQKADDDAADDPLSTTDCVQNHNNLPLSSNFDGITSTTTIVTVDTENSMNWNSDQNTPTYVDICDSPPSSPKWSQTNCDGSNSPSIVVPSSTTESDAEDEETNNNLVVIVSSSTFQEEEQQQVNKNNCLLDDIQSTKDGEQSPNSPTTTSCLCNNLDKSNSNCDEKSLEEQIEESPQYNMTHSTILKTVADTTGIIEEITTTTIASPICNSMPKSFIISLSPIPNNTTILETEKNAEVEDPAEIINKDNDDTFSTISEGDLEDGEIPEGEAALSSSEKRGTRKYKAGFSSSTILTCSTWSLEREEEICGYLKGIQNKFPVSIDFTTRTMKVVDRTKCFINIFLEIWSSNDDDEIVQNVTAHVQNWILTRDKLTGEESPSYSASRSKRIEVMFSLSSSEWHETVRTDFNKWEYYFLIKLMELVSRFETIVTKYEHDGSVHLVLSSSSSSNSSAHQNLEEAKSRLQRYFRFQHPSPTDKTKKSRTTTKRPASPSPVTPVDLKAKKKSRSENNEKKEDHSHRHHHRHSSSSSSSSALPSTTTSTVFYIPKIFDELRMECFLKFLKTLQNEFPSAKISHDIEDLDRMKNLVKISISITTAHHKTTAMGKQVILNWIKKQESDDQLEIEVRNNEEPAEEHQQHHENSSPILPMTPSSPQISSPNFHNQLPILVDLEPSPCAHSEQQLKSPKEEPSAQQSLITVPSYPDTIMVSPHFAKSSKKKRPKILKKLIEDTVQNIHSESSSLTSMSSSSNGSGSIISPKFSCEYVVHYGDWFTESRRLAECQEGAGGGQKKLVKVLNDLAVVMVTPATPSPTTCHMPLLLQAHSDSSLTQARKKLDAYFQPIIQKRMNTTESSIYYNSLVTVATAIDPSPGGPKWVHRWIRQFTINSKDWAKLCGIFRGPERLMSRLGSLVTDHQVSLIDRKRKIDHLIILRGQVKECVDDGGRVIRSILHLFQIPCVMSKTSDSFLKSVVKNHIVQVNPPFPPSPPPPPPPPPPPLSSINSNEKSMSTGKTVWIEKKFWNPALLECAGDQKRLLRRLQLMVREVDVKVSPTFDQKDNKISILIHGGPSNNHKKVHQWAQHKLLKYFNTTEQARQRLLWGVRKVLMDKKFKHNPAQDEG